MKTVAAAIIALTSAAVAQGLLNPSGAPAPTMKTLAQISDQITPIRTDASIAIAAAPFTISASGHYYLKNNISVTTGTAITIDADNVTLDLNGFTISSTASPASGSGVNINGVRKNIQIKNGFISGTTTVAVNVFTTGGFNNGILSASVSSRTIVITGIHVSGVGNSGISLADFDVPATLVDHCTVQISGNFGIVAQTVRASSATDCGGIAIWATTVFDSTGTSVGIHDDDDGIRGTDATNSRGVAGAGFGINVTEHVVNSFGRSGLRAGIKGSNISNSTGIGTTGTGISGANISNSIGSGGSGAGINGINVSNSTGSSGAGTGILATGTASFCRGQRAAGGVAINAAIAIGCTVESPATITSPSKHLGTP